MLDEEQSCVEEGGLAGGIPTEVNAVFDPDHHGASTLCSYNKEMALVDPQVTGIELVVARSQGNAELCKAVRAWALRCCINQSYCQISKRGLVYIRGLNSRLLFEVGGFLEDGRRRGA